MARFVSLLSLLLLLGCPEEAPPVDVPTPECVDPDEADVLMYMPIEQCAAALVGCDAGGEYFEDACGCGCLLE